VELAHKLYEYQIVGINWLIELAKQQVGGLLCDEMGLGKTVQAFGLIKYLKSQNDAKILIVTPASLTINWSRELEKFVPELNYYLHQSQNLIIVSYEILTKDFNNFNKVNWDLVICDEAQNLKNSNSKRHISVSNLRCINKFLVTGTPIENSLTDLWSLINIVRPGLLGDIRNFQLLINDHPSDAKKLSNFAAPLILRRRVKDVAKDLPELVTKELILNGTDSFINFYENRRIELINTKSNSLAALTELIQICCYPGLIDSKYQDAHDAKINETLEILRNIKSNDEKAIVFTTFKSSLDLLSTVISKQLSPNFCSIIDGRIAANRRYEIISKFNNIDGFCVLLIQPKAGGTGLNITSANHVIHFNRQWNPAIERQATARSYRRGQTRTVFEYLISYAGTVEEYISDTLYRKSVLAHYGTEQSEIEGSDKDIQKALELSPLI
jgi:SNF2 family DNA or RNA helicase